MAVFFTEDFEGGDSLATIFDAQVGSTASFDTSRFNTGAQSLLIAQTGSASASKRNLPASLRTLVARVWVNFDANPSATIIAINVDVGSGSALIRLTTAGKLAALFSGHSVVTMGSAISTDAWHSIDLLIDTSGTTWTLDWMVDGVAQTQAVATGQVATDISPTFKVATSGATTINYWFDTLQLADSSGDYPLSDPSSTITVTPGSVSAGAVHGATLVPSGSAAVSAGHVAGGSVHGATVVATGSANVQPGHVAAGAVHGATVLPSGSAPLTPGHVAAGAVHGASLSTSGAGVIPAGHVAAGQVHGAALVGTGAADLTPGHVAGGVVHGATLTSAGGGAIHAGRVTAGSAVHGASLAPSGTSPLAVGHVAGGAVHGARVQTHVDIGALYFGISINSSSDPDYDAYVDGGVGPSGTSYPGLVNQFGRQFAATRQNLAITTGGITGPERYAYGQGRLIQYRTGIPAMKGSDTSTSGTYWASVAAGAYDAEFNAWFAEVLADSEWTAEVPFIYAWDHEYYTASQGGSGFGTAAEFIAACQHVWTLLRASGAHVLDGGNMLLAHCPHYKQLLWDETYGDPASYGGVTSSVEAYTITKTDPGSAYYDLAAADIYVKGGDTYTATDQLAPLIAWASAVGKPFLIGEYGIEPTAAGADITYLDEMDSVLRGAGAGDSAGQCYAIFWTVDSSGDTFQPDANTDRLAWFQAALADPFYSRMPVLPGGPLSTIHVTLDTTPVGGPIGTIHVSLVTDPTPPQDTDGFMVEVAWQDAETGLFRFGVSLIGGTDLLAGLFNPPAYTDITAETQAAMIQRGRADATSEVQPGILDLTLVDETSRYNPANPQSDLYGLVDAGRPVRVSRIWQGVTYRLYQGVTEEVTGPETNDQPYSALTASDLLDRLAFEYPVIASTGLTTTGAAIKTILAAISFDQVSVDTGDQVRDFAADGTVSALDLIGTLLDAEQGAFYIAADGTATYVSHAGRSDLKAQVQDVQLISSGVSIRNVANRAKVTAGDTGTEQVYQDSASIQRYGARDAANTPLQSPYLVSDQAARTLAERIVTLGAQAVAPVFRLTIQGNPEEEPDLYTLLCALDLGDRISVSDAGSGTVGDYTIEGVTHNIKQGGLDHSVTWVLRERARGVFIIGQSVIGGPDKLAV